MVVGRIENAALYNGLGEKFRKAFQYLRETDFDSLEKGKYPVEGEEIFAIVNEFETKDKHDCEVEGHKKHIDIQYVVRGTEMFGYTPLAGQFPIIDYNEENDVSIYKEDVSYIKVEAGMFIIFYPTDLHQPEVKEFEPVLVKKVVVKIKI